MRRAPVTPSSRRWASTAGSWGAPHASAVSSASSSTPALVRPSGSPAAARSPAGGSTTTRRGELARGGAVSRNSRMTTVTRKYVGMGCRRTEDPRLLQGRGQYVDDLRLPNMVHVAFVRSLHAHARITVLDHPPTRALPGVIAVVTARDLQGVKPLRADESDLVEHRVTEWPPLARHKVRFVGEAVAAVAATDPAVAEDAADQLPIGYEPLPPVLTIAEATQPDTPRVHDEWPDNVLMRATGRGGDVAAACRRG